MKKNGFTLMEIMFVVVISTFIFATLLSLFLVTRSSWLTGIVSVELQQKTRMAMDKVVDELRRSSPTVTAIRACLAAECNGQLITFRVPVTGSTGSYYDSQGKIYWGADNNLYDEIQFFARDNRLLRHIVDNTATGACCKLGNCANLGQSTCVHPNVGGSYMGDASTCEDSYICTPAPPPPPPGSCFLSATPILMADGKSKPIEQIKVGDWVMAFDEKTKTLVRDRVSKFFAHESDEYLVINGRLRVTANHPVYSKDKWVPIGSLKIGDSLLNYQGKKEVITEIKKVKEKIKTYNLEVNPYHNYFAAGILAHNKPEQMEGPPFGPGEECEQCRLFRELFGLEEAFAQEDTVLAIDIERIEFSGNPSNFKPQSINITLTARNTSNFAWLNQTVTIISGVTFEN